MPDSLVRHLSHVRATEPHRIAELAASRPRRSSLVGTSGRLMIVAADHPARGALRVGGEPMAMGDRADLLQRLQVALARPGVDGFLGTPDVVEDLLLMGALDDRVVIGSMNRGGLAGTSFEIDDRFTGYSAGAIAAAGLDGGKMMCRIDPDDAATPRTLQACSRAVTDLAERRLMAMVEPFIAHRVGGRMRNDLSVEAVVRSVSVAAGLGETSAHTWLKLPVVDDMASVAAASSLPLLLLGGEATIDADTRRRWGRALAQPTVHGMVVGRALLFPPDGNVADAVDRTVELL